MFFLFLPSDVQNYRIQVWATLNNSRVRVQVQRENLVPQVLKMYSEQPDLVHSSLEVVFEGEKAADLDGVTREFFSIFMREFSSQYLVGNRQKCPDMNHLTLDEDTFEVFGRIVSHAYVLLEYPPIMADAIMAWLACGEVSDDDLLTSVLDFVPDGDGDTLRQVLAHPETLCDRAVQNKCLRILSGLNARKMPDCNIKTLLESIARFCLIRQPMYPLMQFKLPNSVDWL